MKKLFLLLFILIPFQTILPKDKIINTMEKELTRTKKHLKLDNFEPPYFVAYRITDVDGFAAAARIGALFPSPSEKSSKLYVEVRVGSYDFDNFANTDMSFGFHSSDYHPVSTGPIDDNPMEIQHLLWLLTDYKYKQALSTFYRLKGEKIYKNKSEDKIASFSHEKPITYFDKPHKIKLNKKKWKKKIKELSKIFLGYPEIFDSQVQFMATGRMKRFVNSEGTKIAEWSEFYEIHIMGVARAKDGKLVRLSSNFYFRKANKLPDMETLKASVTELINTILALRQADVLQPVTCPTILSPLAAGVFFHETMGHRLEGQRQKQNYEGKTFKTKIGKKILPKFLNIYDDPTVKQFQKTDLYGYYKFDEEGVPAQKTVLIDHGVLKNFLLSRNPVKGFSKSNGHGRASGYAKPVGRMGNLIVTSDKSVPYKKLKELLIKEVKKQKKPFGIIVDQIKGGYTNTGSYGFQAFKGLPTVMHKIDPKTGKETLVRGVEIVGTPLVSINNIIATGNNSGVFNGFCGAESGYIPVSAISPTVLFKEMEFQKDSLKKERPQILPSPYQKKKTE